MPSDLDDIETRIIGCLIEKSIVTPDQYPLTLNVLTSACNQKSSRNPVMALTQGEVQHALRGLETKHLVRTEENFKSRTERYTQRFCNTRYSDLQFAPPELAIVCLLLLRGPQTPGELRARSGRLHTFADNSDVVATLNGLIARDDDPLVVKMPRAPGRKDSEYMHLFSGPQTVAIETIRAETKRPAVLPQPTGVAELERRVGQLEADLAELKKKLQ